MTYGFAYEATEYGYPVGYAELLQGYGYDVPGVIPQPEPQPEPEPDPEEGKSIVRRVVGSPDQYPFWVNAENPEVLRKFSVDKPIGVVSAALIVWAIDADNAAEISIEINGASPIILFGDQFSHLDATGIALGVGTDALGVRSIVIQDELWSDGTSWSDGTGFVGSAIGTTIALGAKTQIESTLPAQSRFPIPTSSLVDGANDFVFKHIGGDGAQITQLAVEFIIYVLPPEEGGPPLDGVADPFFATSNRSPVIVLEMEAVPLDLSGTLTWTPAQFPGLSGWYEATHSMLPAIGEDVRKWCSQHNPAICFDVRDGTPRLEREPACRFVRAEMDSMRSNQPATIYWDAIAGGLILLRVTFRTPPQKAFDDYRKNELICATESGQVGVYARTGFAEGSGDEAWADGTLWSDGTGWFTENEVTAIEDEYALPGYWVEGYSTGGLVIQCAIRDAQGAVKMLELQGTIGETHLVMMRWTGNTLAVSLDGGAETAVTAPQPGTINDRLMLGGGGTHPAAYADMDLSLVVLSNQQGERADRAQLIDYAQQLIYLATHAFVTQRDDLPRDRWVPGALVRNSALSYRAESVDGRYGGVVEISSAAQFEIANPHGGFDYLMEYAIDGRDYRLRGGELDYNGDIRMDQLRDLHVGIGSHWEADQDQISYIPGDRGLKIRTPAQPAEYDGSGHQTLPIEDEDLIGIGHEGPPELAGRRKPLLRGWALNMEPQLLDSGRLLYQLSSESLDAVLVVYDKMVPIDLDVIYPDYNSLYEATVAAGKYSACLGCGMIKLGSQPVGRLTVDAYAGESASVADIILWFLRESSLLDDSEIDIPAFQAMASLQPAPAGLYLPAGNSADVRDVARDMARGIGAIVGENRRGVYTIRRLDAPLDVAPYELTEDDLLDFRMAPLGHRIPIKEAVVEYRPNYALMNSDEIGGAATTDARTRAERPFAEVVARSVDGGKIHQAAASMRVQTHLYRAVDAQDEAFRVVHLYGETRRLLVVRSVKHVLSARLGDTVRVKLPRYGMTNGRHMVVVELDDDLEAGESEVVLFG